MLVFLHGSLLFIPFLLLDHWNSVMDSCYCLFIDLLTAMWVRGHLLYLDDNPVTFLAQFVSNWLQGYTLFYFLDLVFGAFI